MQRVAPVASANCNKSGRVKAAEAARELAINRSSLKRYFDQYPELLDGQKTVDLAELKQHRADNPRIVDAAASSKDPRTTKSEGGSRVNDKHALEKIKLWREERTYAEEIGQLVDPTEMIDAMAESAVALRDKFMTPDPVLCERVAGESDPRVVMSIIRDANRTLLDDFAARMKTFGEEALKPPGGIAAPPDNAGP